LLYAGTVTCFSAVSEDDPHPASRRTPTSQAPDNLLIAGSVDAGNEAGSPAPSFREALWSLPAIFASMRRPHACPIGPSVMPRRPAPSASIDANSPPSVIVHRSVPRQFDVAPLRKEPLREVQPFLELRHAML